MEEKYTITRFFLNGYREVIKTDLSHDEAVLHCTDRETSSTTCISSESKERTKKYGSWFEGWQKQKQ